MKTKSSSNQNHKSKNLTMESSVYDVYKNPIGYDIIQKLLMQMGKSENLVLNPFVKNLKLKTLIKLFKNKISQQFFDSLLFMLNRDTQEFCASKDEIVHAWWKEAVFYQIYPRSFYDSNDDGIGDLRGIIEKLDYLKELGINAIWLSPIYDSPNDDNGYDIRDYYKIMAEFGTMADFDELLSCAHEKGIRLIMDLVVNHTSDEHEWFKSALNDKNSPYRNYYFIRDDDFFDDDSPIHDKKASLNAAKVPAAAENRNLTAKTASSSSKPPVSQENREFSRETASSSSKPPVSQEKCESANETASSPKNQKNPPNNWTSFFSGSAWNHYEKQKLWALHLFSKKQIDLNWDNPSLRNDVIKMINWWLDKGVDGFRLDVINYISKTPGLPQGDKTIGQLIGFTGMEHYFYGPHLHEYLNEINQKAFSPHKAFSVGETPGLGLKMAQLVTAQERKELDMIFNFDHLETPGHVRFDDYEYDLNFYRDFIVNWMQNYGNQCWTSLFFDNHDNPRMISKVTKDKNLQVQVAKLLATMQMTLKGTPFIFQGDEIGLRNYDFTSIDQITDVESKGKYKELCAKMSETDAFKIILAGTREHARVLLPWNKNPNENHAESQNKNPQNQQKVAFFENQEIHLDVENVYKKLISLRKENLALVYGNFTLLKKKHDRFTFSREYKGETFIIDCNLGQKTRRSHKIGKNFNLIFDTYDEKANHAENLSVLKPYEARIFYWKSSSSITGQ